MAYIDALTEQEVTLRDFKSVLNRLMTNYNPKKPVTITIEEDGESRTFSLVPKRTRRRSNGEAFAIKEIPFETLEEPKEPGTYMAIDTFNIAENTPIPFVYGLYVDLTAFGIYAFLTTVPVVKNGLTRRSNYLKNRRCI